MELLDISLKSVAQLCHQASLGRLLGGLIHNINSPLHSLGMQIDVIQHFILKKGEIGTDILEKISARLTQMNDEFDNLNSQIRISGMRADLLASPPENLDINYFLRQELQFLKANLYFKHNVEITLELSPSLPVIAPSSSNFSLGTSLLLEGLAEKIAEMGSKRLFLGTRTEGERPVVVLRVENAALPDSFRDAAKMDLQGIRSLPEESGELNLFISVLLLKTEGIEFETEMKDQATSIKLMFPRQNNTGEEVFRSNLPA